MDCEPAVGWLATQSLEELRQAISEAIPELAGRHLVLNDRVVTSNPRYFQGSAVLDGAYVVKFAWSEPAARRIAHEARLLEALAKAEQRAATRPGFWRMWPSSDLGGSVAGGIRTWVVLALWAVVSPCWRPGLPLGVTP